MTPSSLTDAELLRFYDDLFRQHPATAELAGRFEGGSALTVVEEERDDALKQLEAADGRIDRLEEALESCCDNEKGARAAGRKLLRR